MKGIRLIGRDLKAMFAHKHGRIAIIFLMIVPLIYAGFFLAGYWNPYGKLDQLPVAVVNMDKGAVMDGKTIQAGHDFVENLKTSKDLDFEFVSASEAANGLKDGRYYMTVTVPETFSKQVSTLMDPNPQPAQLEYAINPGKNFVASQITSTAAEKMKAKLSASITKSYTEGVLGSMNDMAQGFRDAGDGASQLHQGASDASDGAAKLSDGIQKLTSGADKLQSGSDQLASGAQQLGTGVKGVQQGTASLADGLGKLNAAHQTIEAGATKLSDGTKALSDGQTQVSQGVSKLDDTAKLLQAKLQQYLQQHPEAQQDADLQTIAKLTDGIAAATGSLHQGETKLTDSTAKLLAGQAQFDNGLNQFGDKLNEAAGGAKKLSDGSAQLATGFSKWETGFLSLHGGIADLASGGKQANDGAGKLADGLVQLSDGSGELSTKLTDAAQKTSDLHTGDAVAAMFSEPVQLVESKLSNVDNYGTGIAPYFLSLAFYVGGIMAANILPLGRRENRQNITGTHHFINKLGLVYSIGLIQSAIVDLVVLAGFKLQVASVPMFLLSSLIVSFTFMTFILMLVTVFGLVGKFLAVTLLVLQLATCGGTFPTELSTPFLSAVGQLLPMAHSLRGLQSVISLGDWSELRMQILLLLCYLVFAGLVSWGVSHLQHRKPVVASSH